MHVLSIFCMCDIQENILFTRTWYANYGILKETKRYCWKRYRKGAELGTKGYDGAKDAAKKGYDKAKEDKKK